MNTLTDKRKLLSTLEYNFKDESRALEQSRQRIETLRAEIAELEKCERWKPGPGDLYWSFNLRGEVYCSKWVTSDCYSHPDDVNRYKHFNCFKTQAEAETQAKRDRVRRKADWAYGVAQPNGFSGSGYVYAPSGYLLSQYGLAVVGLLHFSSSANAARFRELMGEDFEAWLKL